MLSRRERKKEETRKKIISCAMEFFKEKGFQDTLMEEIAEKADVSKGTLYNYFQNKESILAAYFKLVIAEHDMNLKECLIESSDIRSGLNKIVSFMNEIFLYDAKLAAIYFNYRMRNFFESDPLDNSQRSGLETVLFEVIKSAQDIGELRVDIPALAMARNFQIAIMISFLLKLHNNIQTESYIAESELIEIFLNGAKS